MSQYVDVFCSPMHPCKAAADTHTSIKLRRWHVGKCFDVILVTVSTPRPLTVERVDSSPLSIHCKDNTRQSFWRFPLCPKRLSSCLDRECISGIGYTLPFRATFCCISCRVQTSLSWSGRCAEADTPTFVFLLLCAHLLGVNPTLRREWIEYYLEEEISVPLDNVAGSSVYFGGKNLMAYAQLCLVADEIGRQANGVAIIRA